MENEERRGSGEPLNLYAGEAWPYPRGVYLLRALWGIVWGTVWQVAWVRVPILRTTILRLFGAKVAGLVWMPGSVRILSQSRACAENLTEYLQNNPRFSSAKPGSNSFLTTGDVETVSERASLFYGARVEFSKI